MPESGDEMVGAVMQQGTRGRIDARARIRGLPATLRARVSFLLALMLAALVLRLVAAVAVDQILHAVGRNGFLGADDVNYDRVAWQQAQAWSGVGPEVSITDRYLLNVYTYTEAALYLIVGHRPLAMKLLNCAFGALTAAIIYLIGRRIFGEVAGRLSGIAAAFFPSTFLWSLVNLKDAMFILVVALILWLLTMVVLGGRRWLLLPLLLAFAVVGGLRLHIQLLLAAVVPGTAILQDRRSFPGKWQNTVLLLAGCMVILVFSGAGGLLGIDVEQLNNQRYYAAMGAQSAYVPTPVPVSATTGTNADEIRRPSSLQSLIAWLPTGLVFTLAAPFPWEADRVTERIFIPEMLLWYLALILAVLGIAAHWRFWPRYIHILGYLAGMCLIMAVIQGNLGTLVRQRGMMIPFTLIFSGAGAAWLWSRYTGRASRARLLNRSPGREVE